MLSLRDHEHWFEDCRLSELAAQFGTPLYIYSATQLERNFRAYQQAANNHLIAYAVKANSSHAILQLLASWGSGFDIVSIGELQRVLAAGGSPEKIIFSGVGKSNHEMHFALSQQIHCFNVESKEELFQLNAAAAAINQQAPISLRVNPHIDAKTHPYISTGLSENKFGVAHTQALGLYQLASSLPHLKIIGIDCHIGSQILDTAPLFEAIDRLLDLCDQLRLAGISLQHIDIGGGLGIAYQPDSITPNVSDFATAAIKRIHARIPLIKIILEPGRSIAGNTGLLLSRVITRKLGAQKNFLVLDAAMNDLMRPALYQAYHRIESVRTDCSDQVRQYDVVGPVCETGDQFGQSRSLAIAESDLVMIADVGAYGMSMASNYNSRPRAAEVLVKGAQVQLIRPRETVAQLLAQEIPLNNSLLA